MISRYEIKSGYLGIRIDKATLRALDQLARIGGESRGVVVRQLIRERAHELMLSPTTTREKPKI